MHASDHRHPAVDAGETVGLRAGGAAVRGVRNCSSARTIRCSLAVAVLLPYGVIYLAMTMVLGVPEARGALARARRLRRNGRVTEGRAEVTEATGSQTGKRGNGDERD